MNYTYESHSLSYKVDSKGENHNMSDQLPLCKRSVSQFWGLAMGPTTRFQLWMVSVEQDDIT